MRPYLIIWALCAFVMEARPSETVDAVIDQLRPTQAHLGLFEIQVKKKELEKLRKDPKAWAARSEEKQAKGVRGPGNKIYLIDGHHEARALHDLGIERMQVEIVADLSALSEEKFWQKMEKEKWCYPFDLEGKRIRKWPTKISQLTDDPYRSIAWFVRRAGGFKNLNVPFQEFYWADYFRSKVQLRSSSFAAYVAACNEALEISRSPAAEALPGFIETGLRNANRCKLVDLLNTR